MNGQARRSALLGSALVLLGGCGWLGWFGRSSEPLAASVSEVSRAREARPPAGQPVDGKGSTIARDSDEVVDRVVAVVNQEAITLSELLDSVAYHVYESGQQVPPEGERALKERLLRRLVDQRLQLQEAERDRVVVEDVEIAEQMADMMKRAGVASQEELERAVTAQGLSLDSVKRRVREQVMIQKVVRRKVAFRISVTEDEIERYFLQNRAKLETGLSFHARHILIAVPSSAQESEWEAARLKAEEVWSLVRAGHDFAGLARKHSTDSSAVDGGDLGVMKQGELAPEIEAEILRIRPGEAAGPFRSRLGYHIFKLEWRESLSGPALIQTKQQIRDILFREKYQARLAAWLEEIRQRAIIEIRL
jgi:peptidyl-prolyl cis-trans isomerase SurA